MRVQVVGVPFNSSGREDGVARAPAALRRAGLVSRLAERAEVDDTGDVGFEPPRPERSARSGLLSERSLVSMVQRTREAVAAVHRAGGFPLVLGGDCSILLGGMLAALMVASFALPEGRSGWLLPVGAVVVASSANLANLLDLRPGRCAKVFLPLWVAGCLLDPPGGAWSAGLAGAALAALPFDLREQGMLGDAGANALGAVVGTLLLAGPVWLLLLVAAVLLALQLLSERVSFSRVIDGNRVLRAADRFGRLDP